MLQIKKTARLIKLLACFGFLSFVGFAYAYSEGPLPGFTGAPNEGNCTECHDSFGEETNTGSGSVSITHTSRYEMNQHIPITVNVEQPGARRWGFQFTALATDTGEPVGQFVITDAEHTQLIEGFNGRWYVEHTGAGTFPGTAGGQWTFEWVAPDTDVGPVAFYAAGNAANNDGDRLGDRIYTALSTISPPSYPATDLLTLNGGEVLNPGEKVTIEWDATANASTFDILYFPFSGALPDTIAYGLPAEARSYEWTVPNQVTDAARVAVIAFNDVGFGVDESEQTFLIVNQSASVQITEPNQPRTVKGGDVLRVAWTIGNMVSVNRQQVRLSLDGGKTFPQILAPNVPANTRNFNWTVPANIRTQTARVLIVVRTNDGNLFADANEADVMIDNPEPE